MRAVDAERLERPAVLRDVLKVGLDSIKFINQHSLQQRDLTWKAGIDRLLAHPQFFRKIIHRHTSESVQKEVSSSGKNNACRRRLRIERRHGCASRHNLKLTGNLGNHISVISFLRRNAR